MKNLTSSRAFCFFFVVLLLWINVPAQLQLGPQRLLSVPAPTLKNRTRLSVGLGRRGFVGRIGGVAFDETAKPTKDFVVSNIDLKYSPDKQDGKRLAVNVNGQSVSADIYDWQLIPIAKFADSDSFSCFTLFGKLSDASDQEKYGKKGWNILNYHEAFKDTLLGLRLFQLDNLIINDYSYDLPKDGGEYVLGAGESAPDTDANEKARLGFDAFFRQSVDPYNEPESYVISDYTRNIVFNVANDKLDISEQPSYYFWAYDKAPLVVMSLLGGPSGIKNRLNAEIVKQRQQSPRTFNEKNWVIKQLIAKAKEYDIDNDSDEPLENIQKTEIDQFLSTNDETKREAFLKLQTIVKLKNLYVELVIINSLKPVAVKPLNEKISKETKMLRDINPAVWDAATNVMRYAAFFRYCKRKNPNQWLNFINQIKKAPPLIPSVTTPTVMEVKEKPKPEE